MSNATIEYYNKNAESFCADTISANMIQSYEPFLELLPNKAKILDAGCGSGRDTKYFLEKGYSVDAFDASEKLCLRATEYTKIKVIHSTFQNLSIDDKYDGIWACASLLHLPLKELPSVFIKLRNLLKDTGVLYVSFKYGEFQGERNGRYFTYLTEKSLAQLLSQINGLSIQKYWITGDARKGREKEKWLNATIILNND